MKKKIILTIIKFIKECTDGIGSYFTTMCVISVIYVVAFFQADLLNELLEQERRLFITANDFALYCCFVVGVVELCFKLFPVRKTDRNSVILFLLKIGVWFILNFLFNRYVLIENNPFGTLQLNYIGYFVIVFCVVRMVLHKIVEKEMVTEIVRI